MRSRGCDYVTRLRARLHFGRNAVLTLKDVIQFMPVRKTESRIPLNLQPSDLGQAVVAPDGRCTLVSFVTSPVVVNRENAYVVFITNAGLAALASSFEWTFVEGGNPPQVQTSQFGEVAHKATNLGTLNIEVRVLDASNVEQAKLTMVQDVVPPSAELEALISESLNKPGPAIGSPDVLRELINEHNLYYQNVALQTAESGDAFKRFVFSVVYDGASRRKIEERKHDLDQLALSLNDGTVDFTTLSAKGAGVCGIRLLLLSMTAPDMLEFTFLPEEPNKRSLALEQLLQAIGSLAENKRIDLFNIVRFPKTNITFCGRILETLRSKYFSTTTFEDVLTSSSGLRAQWIVAQYVQGPVTRSP